MRLNSLTPQKGSKKDAKRLGRGHSAGQGKTAGRGTKGAKARGGNALAVMRRNQAPNGASPRNCRTARGSLRKTSWTRSAASWGLPHRRYAKV